MTGADTSRSDHASTIERDGWRISLDFEDAVDPAGREAIIGTALEVAAGRGPALLRRSRRGSTYRVSSKGQDFFVKLIDAPRGFGRLKRWFSPSPAAHIRSISNAIRRAGLNAPAVVLSGRELSSGREIVMTPRARGVMSTRYLRGLSRAEFARKRALLRAIGAEVARLHGARFIHGDLTPFNIIVEDGATPRVWFIDHERTRTTPVVMPDRARLRNLVQLGHFSFPGLSRTDRMRVWSSYAAATVPSRGRAELRRLLRMLSARIARDGALGVIHPAAVPSRGEVREG